MAFKIKKNNQTPSIIFVTDSECRIVSANEKLVKMTGYATVDDIIGKTVEEVLNIKKSVIRSSIEIKEHILKINENYFDEYNGKRFLIYAIPLIDKHKNIIGGIELIIDVHNQILHNKDLVTQGLYCEDRKEQLTNLTAIDIQHHLNIFINSKQNSKPTNFVFSQFSDDAKEVIENGIQKLLNMNSDDRISNIEYDYKSIIISEKEDSEDLGDEYVHAIVSHPSNEIDKSTVVVEYVSDDYITEVTDLNNLKKEWQKREFEYRSLLESMDNPIFILNRDCQYLFINDCYLLNFKGLSKDDIIGMPYSEFHNEIQSRKMIDRVEEVFLTKRTIQYEYQQDVDAYFLQTLSPFMNEEGEITAVTVFSKDISEIKKARTALRQKTKSSKNFAHIVLYDFKTPLFTIRGFARMLHEKLEGNIDNELMKYISYIEHNAKKMDDLMEDSIKYSQIEYILYPDEEVPFRNIIDEAIIQLKPMITSNNILVRAESDLPMVCVDRRRMVEVIINLIENSIVYNKGLSNLVINIGCRKDNGKFVFFVKDNGKGIDKKFHDKIFNMFYKLDASSDGTGAGLAIVKKIIESHEGKIWVESDGEFGCTICFTLFSEI